MQKQLKQLKLLFQNKLLYPVLFIYTINIVLVIFAIYTGFSLYSFYTKYQTVNDKTEVAKNAADIIRNNKDLVDSTIDDYNNTLQKIIPDAESYFTVISALEQIATRTGVDITSYSIDIDATTEQKLTLKVEMQGSPESLKRFYDMYQYGGGRLITSDSVELTDITTGKIVVNMNFYHKQNTSKGLVQAPQITQKDIDIVTDIASKL